MQLLAEKPVKLRVIAAISDETVRRMRKKTSSSRSRKGWCLPRVSAELVWRREAILALYAEPYNARYPLVCCDESPYQLVTQ
jgi:hypothetical protein